MSGGGRRGLVNLASLCAGEKGYTGIIAPLVANGVVITGVAGGDRTTRGFLDGWEPETGKKLWRRYTIPAPGEPGSETWPKDMPDA